MYSVHIKEQTHSEIYIEHGVLPSSSVTKWGQSDSKVKWE